MNLVLGVRARAILQLVKFVRYAPLSPLLQFGGIACRRN